jgi:hypothetical protein
VVWGCLLSCAGLRLDEQKPPATAEPMACVWWERREQARCGLEAWKSQATAERQSDEQMARPDVVLSPPACGEGQWCETGKRLLWQSVSST